MFKYLVVIILPMMFGCATKIKTSLGNEQSGLRYPLPINRLQLTVTKTTSYPDDIVFNRDALVASPIPATSDISSLEHFLADFIKTCYAEGAKKQTSKLDKTEILKLSDWKQVHTVAIDPEWLSAGSLTINRGESGLLKSINVSSDGQADEVLKTSLSLAGTVVGFTTLSPQSIGAAAGTISDIANLISVKDSGSNFKSYDLAFLDEQESKINTCFISRKFMLKVYEVDAFIKDDTNKSVELAVFSGFVDPLLFEEAKKLEESIKELDEKKSALAIKLGKAKTDEDILSIKAELAVKNDALDMQESRANALSKVLADAQAKVYKVYGIKPTKEETLVKDFDLSDLLSVKAEQLDTNDSFNELGVAVLLDKPEKIAQSGTGTVFNDDKMYIAYRDPETFIASTYVKNGETWKKVSAAPVNLISSSSPIGYMEFKASNWSKRTMNLSFSDTGILTSAQYENESDAAAISDALNQGATSYIANLKSAQETKQAINAATRKEHQDNLQFQIDLLEKQKNLLDARNVLNLENNSSSAQLAEINQQISLLEAQKSLLDAQSNLESSELTSGLNTDLLVLQAELEKLNAQQALSNTQSSSEAVAGQIATLMTIGSLQQQLVGESDQDEISKIEENIKKLEIELSVLIKELELRGFVTSP